MTLHAAVIFDTRYGLTAQVARALARGLARVPDLESEVDFAPDVHADVLDRSDLILIGGPTEYFSASHHLRQFFGFLGAFDLHGKFGFAFDTHAARPLAGSAARFIERNLKLMGVEFLEPRASALVESHAAGPAGAGLGLAAGDEQRFEAIGERLGHELLQAIRDRRARRAVPATAEWSR
jgi:flavorubredoxin